jgi:protein-S-isoprenylcysteine O-methyltransferase Ste14
MRSQDLELRVPPPLVTLFMAVCMWGLSFLGLTIAIPAGLRTVIALVSALTGVGIIVAGIAKFVEARTTVNPMHPDAATSLVTDGIFAFTRNPMYLGLLLLLVAWGIHLAAVWGFLGPVLFALYISRFQIQPEERALADRFGSAYADYTQRVGRWL